MFDSQVPSFHDALGEATLQVTLSARQTPRLTWLTVLRCHAVVPVFVKIAANWPDWPNARFRNADSPKNDESYPGTAAWAGPAPTSIATATTAPLSAATIPRM